MAAILIDYENVNEEGLKGVNYLNENDIVFPAESKKRYCCGKDILYYLQ